MFGKVKHLKKNSERVITGRGPGSGSGAPLSDEDAIAILDERIENPNPKKSPDLGVVIDPSHTSRPLAWNPKRELSTPGEPTMFDPSPYTEFENFWTKATAKFEPEVPNCIVVAPRVETPLYYILQCADPQVSLWKQASGSLWVRLILEKEEEAVDLSLPKQMAPGITLLDLLREHEH